MKERDLAECRSSRLLLNRSVKRLLDLEYSNRVRVEEKQMLVKRGEIKESCPT